jgi:hypothetical protein
MTTPPPPQIHYRPWGWGHNIKSPKPNNTTRLYYKNTNGIRTRAFTNRLTTLHHHHKAMESNISLYTKTNMDWRQLTTKHLNETHCQQLYHNAIFAYSTQNTSAKHWYQHGGTMIASTRTIAACLWKQEQIQQVWGDTPTKK